MGLDEPARIVRPETAPTPWKIGQSVKPAPDFSSCDAPTVQPQKMENLDDHTNLKQDRTCIVVPDHSCLNAPTVVRNVHRGRNDIGHLEEFVPRREHHVAGIVAIEEIDQLTSIRSDQTFTPANLPE